MCLIKGEEFLHSTNKIPRKIDQNGGSDYISIILQYIIERSELVNKDAFFTIINTEISADMGDKIMTLAEQLRQEGRFEGKMEGKLEGKMETAKRLLEAGLDISFIAKATDLPINKIKETHLINVD